MMEKIVFMVGDIQFAHINLIIGKPAIGEFMEVHHKNNAQMNAYYC